MKRRLVAVLAIVPLLAAGAPAAAQQPQCTTIPAGEESFEVCEDEFFVFTANFKPWENEGVFDKYIGDPIRAQFPGVDLKFAAWGEPIRYQDIVDAGVVPDLVLEDPRRRIDRDLEPIGWVQDMSGMIADSEIDLEQLNQAAVEQVRSRSDGGMYGVPLFVNERLLFYNKKIFDKLDVRYPEPGMTYDEAYRKAKRLTKQVGLDAYKGYLQHPDNYLEFNQRGLYPFLPTGSENPAPEDVKVNVTSEAWMDLGRNLERFLLIPRNIFTSVDDFAVTGKVAMAVDNLEKLHMYALNEDYIQDEDEADYREWMKNVELGVGPVPMLDRGSRTTYQPSTMAAFVPPGSDMQAKAVDIIEWLVSEQGQRTISAGGMKAVLETNEVVESFGADVPALAEVDTSAVYWGENAVIEGYRNTEFWDIPLYMVFRQHVLLDGMTVESALTVAEQQDIPAYIKERAEAGFDW